MTLGVRAVCWLGPRPLRATRPARDGGLLVLTLRSDRGPRSKPDQWLLAASSISGGSSCLAPRPGPSVSPSATHVGAAHEAPRLLWSEPAPVCSLAPGALLGTVSAPVSPHTSRSLWHVTTQGTTLGSGSRLD